MNEIPKVRESGGTSTKESTSAEAKKAVPSRTRGVSESNVLSILHRYDANIAMANHKASFLIGVVSILFVAAMFKRSDLLAATEIASASWLNNTLYLLLGLGLIGVFLCSLLVVLPITTSGHKHGEYTSFISYSSVARMDPETFGSKLASMDYDFWDDLVRQTHYVAKITTVKFRILVWASRLALASVVFAAVLFLVAIL